MTAATGLEDAFGAAVFGEAKPEGYNLLRPVLIRARVHAHSAGALHIVATDCYFLAWESILSVTSLDNLEKNEIMQKQLEALSFLDKRKATKPKLVADQVPSVSGVILGSGSDQVTAPVQQQISVSPSKVPPAKATKRVAPISRRARVQGALLQGTDENDENS